MQVFPDYVELHSKSCSEFSHAVAYLGGHPTQVGFLSTPILLKLSIFMIMVLEY